ncbi:hypothetical protein K8Z61_17945 [Nocardioides sp. TRM66260-LWL]|uniref:hypothetical protein n=1 Tax=Nocardioides sp. TRM66260-LWL TaxID=2874478 RepID=UPI001CC78765|nr:hypothetical protein [Nocardioides sp. TRM66260-LWL]MBZ5736377.1 hypothetical protein [Nocardioides sp. TRM66260-LWL]
MTAPEPAPHVGDRPVWFPVDHEADAATTRVALAEEFPQTPASLLDSYAAGITTLAGQLSSAMEGTETLLGVWVMLPRGGAELGVDAAATFSLVPADADLQIGEVIDLLIGGSELHQPPDVQEVDTASGPSTLVRIRRASRSGWRGRRIELSETAAVVWLPTSTRRALLLLRTVPVDDLVLAADVAENLVALAAGIQGV